MNAVARRRLRRSLYALLAVALFILAVYGYSEHCWREMEADIARARQVLASAPSKRVDLRPRTEAGNAVEDILAAGALFTKLFPELENIEEEHEMIDWDGKLRGPFDGPLHADQVSMLLRGEEVLRALHRAATRADFVLPQASDPDYKVYSVLERTYRFLAWALQRATSHGAHTMQAEILLDALQIADDSCVQTPALALPLGLGLLQNTVDWCFDADSYFDEALERTTPARGPVCKMDAWPRELLQSFAAQVAKLDRPITDTKLHYFSACLQSHDSWNGGAHVRGTLVFDWRCLFSGTLSWASGVREILRDAERAESLSALPWPEQLRALEALDASQADKKSRDVPPLRLHYQGAADYARWCRVRLLFIARCAAASRTPSAKARALPTRSRATAPHSRLTRKAARSASRAWTRNESSRFETDDRRDTHGV